MKGRIGLWKKKKEILASSPVESKSVIKKNNINDKRISLLIRELSK